MTALPAPRIGSLCSGYGGLELGLMLALDGGTVAWHAEYDDAPAAVLAHHWPDVPNLRDITTVDWADVEPVDWLTAGYPCQPFSLAGHRKGSDDDRHLWPYVAAAIGVLRPRRVLLENVAGHVTLGMGAVLGDLAAMGYDAVWGLVRASDADAPHRRERLFIVARDADGVAGSTSVGVRRRRGTVDGPGPVPGTLRPDRLPVPDTDGAHERAVVAGALRGESEAPIGDGGRSAADAAWVGRPEGRPEPAGRPAPPSDACGERSERPPSFGELARTRSSVHRQTDWGAYAPAIARWAAVLGRDAPLPTEPGTRGQPRLSPAFVEWLMGLPAGHVTAVPGITRNAQLKALGNGVVPQQAALAVRILLNLHADLERTSA